MEANGRKKILISSRFGTAASNICITIAELVKKLCIMNISNSRDYASLESWVVCRLKILFNKNLGPTPTSIGEALRRISVKAIMMTSKENVMQIAGSLQVCVRQEAQIETTICAVHDFFKD